MLCISDKIKMVYSIAIEYTMLFSGKEDNMAKIKIFNSEMHLMNKIWDEGTIKAVDLANWALENLGWKKNTTYTVIKKLVDKHAVLRSEPDFVITPIVTRAEIAAEETNELVEKMFKGNMSLFLTSLFENRELTKEEIKTLRELINKN